MMRRWFLIEGLPGKLVETDPTGRMLGMRFVAPAEGVACNFPACFVPERQIVCGPIVERAIAKRSVAKLEECVAPSYAAAAERFAQSTQGDAAPAPATVKRSK